MNARPHPLERFNMEDYLIQEMQLQTLHEYPAGQIIATRGARPARRGWSQATSMLPPIRRTHPLPAPGNVASLQDIYAAQPELLPPAAGVSNRLNDQA